LEQLVPSESLRNYISRSHFELSWEASTIVLTKFSQNCMWINDRIVPAFQPVAAADEDHIKLCGPDANAPFLILRLRVGDLAATEGQVEPPRQVWPQHRHASGFALTCTFALGSHMNDTQQGLKTIDVPTGSQLVVGRQQQQGFFEALLRQEPCFLNYVSRAHFELVEVATGSFRIGNWSVNPIVVEACQLERGQQTIVSPPALIEFVAGELGGLGTVVYLRLRLERVHALAGADTVSVA